MIRSGPGAACDRPIQVLLIEDDQEHADWTVSLLASDSGDFRVERTGTLVEAMIRLSEPQIDVILLDLGMPELQGYRSHTAIRAMAPRIPVVILTGDDSYVSRDAAWAGGAKDYLLKGETSADQLRRALQRALAQEKGPPW